MAKMKGIFKVEKLTLKMLPGIALLLLATVILASLNNPMTASMSTIIGIIAMVVLIVGVLISEAMSKKVPGVLKWAIFVVALLVVLAIVPPLAGIAIPYLTAYAIGVEAIGALLCAIMLFV